MTLPQQPGLWLEGDVYEGWFPSFPRGLRLGEQAERLIAKHVDVLGRVDYGALGVNGLLWKALDGIAVQDPRAFREKAEALASYLNAYNLAARGIAARLAGRSPRFHRHGLRGWWTRFRFFFL